MYIYAVKGFLQGQQSCLEFEKRSFFILVRLSLFVCCVCEYHPLEVGFELTWLPLSQCDDSTFRRLRAPDLNHNLLFSRNFASQYQWRASVWEVTHPLNSPPLIREIFQGPIGLKHSKLDTRRNFLKINPKVTLQYIQFLHLELPP